MYSNAKCSKNQASKKAFSKAYTTKKPNVQKGKIAQKGQMSRKDEAQNIFVGQKSKQAKCQKRPNKKVKCPKKAESRNANSQIGIKPQRPI